MKVNESTALIWEDEFLGMYWTDHWCENILALSQNKLHLSKYIWSEKLNRFMKMYTKSGSMAVAGELGQFGWTIESLDPPAITLEFSNEFEDEWKE